MKFAEYLRCHGCGKMIPKEPYIMDGKAFCSKECYDFIQWYQERRTHYIGEKVKES